MTPLLVTPEMQLKQLNRSLEQQYSKSSRHHECREKFHSLHHLFGTDGSQNPRSEDIAVSTAFSTLRS